VSAARWFGENLISVSSALMSGSSSSGTNQIEEIQPHDAYDSICDAVGQCFFSGLNIEYRARSDE